MNILTLPELFYLTSINLNDKEKIFLASSSKITCGFKSLIKLDLEYNLEVCDKWCVKNIFIEEFTLESKIKELIENSIHGGGEKVGTTFGDPESIVANSKYVKFISNNTNIKLFHNEEITEKIVSYGCNYMAMKIMLNNNGSIENINNQFINASMLGYLEIVRLLINLENWNKIPDFPGANVCVDFNCAIVIASRDGYLSIVKLLIDHGAKVSAQNNRAIILASLYGHLSVVKLLIENGADIHAIKNRAIAYAIKNKHLDVIKLLIESGADIRALNNKHQDIIELLKN